MEHPILPDFQKFLLSRGFAPPKTVPFYANWVSKFIAFSNSNKSLSVINFVRFVLIRPLSRLDPVLRVSV